MKPRIGWLFSSSVLMIWDVAVGIATTSIASVGFAFLIVSVAGILLDLEILLVKLLDYDLCFMAVRRIDGYDGLVSVGLIVGEAAYEGLCRVSFCVVLAWAISVFAGLSPLSFKRVRLTRPFLRGRVLRRRGRTAAVGRSSTLTTPKEDASMEKEDTDIKDDTAPQKEPYTIADSYDRKLVAIQSEVACSTSEMAPKNEVPEENLSKREASKEDVTVQVETNTSERPQSEIPPRKGVTARVARPWRGLCAVGSRKIQPKGAMAW